jgi:tagatose 1,6-diphosphate aldolase
VKKFGNCLASVNHYSQEGSSTMVKIRMSQKKFERMNAVADQRGVIAALAMDQRGSLQKSIGKAKGGEATAQDLVTFKSVVAEVLSPYASAILLDPEYGLEAVHCRAKGSGVFLAYEKTGYDTSARGRLPDLIPGFSVRRLMDAGADVVKFLLYYDPDDDPKINAQKQAFVERIGAECRANDAPLFLEVVAYSDAVPDEKSIDFARIKPGKVMGYMREFSQPQYGVDVLKVESPVNMRYLEGSRANPDGQVAYTREQAKQYFSQAAAAARLPFIYLSAGVSDAVFRETLELAAEAGTPFSGVLCGRATWQEGIPEYAHGGPEALRAWLRDRGVRNIQELNQTVASGAKPWWDFYGGRDQIELVES